MADIFISHVEEDADIALTIAIGLEEAGFSTWCYEADNVPGPSYLLQTSRAVEKASTIVIVISPKSIGSKQVTKEIVHAHEAGKEFIPVRRDISHLQFQNQQPEWREAFGAASSVAITSDNTENVIQRIIEGIKGLGVEPGAKVSTARRAQLHSALANIRSEAAAITPEPPPPIPTQEPKPDLPSTEKAAEIKAEQPASTKIPEIKTDITPPIETMETKPELTPKIPKIEEKPGEIKASPKKAPGTKKPLKLIGFIAGGVVLIAAIAIGVLFLTGVFSKAALSLTVSPTGGGTITPMTITYKTGTKVSLEATPAEGYIFNGWSGDVTGTTSTLTFNIEKDSSIVANFIRLYNLNTNTDPGDGGEIKLDPSGGTYTESSVVTLKATPAKGYIFDLWSGDASGTTAEISIKMDGEKSATANFKHLYELTTSSSPDASGSIVISPPNSIFIEHAEVTIRAVPADGYLFDRWSGDASGTTNPLKINVDKDTNIFAIFVKQQFKLTTSVNLAAGGTVSPSTGFFDVGSNIVVTATPAKGYLFDRWTGDASGDSASVDITVDQAKNMVAHFAKIIFEDQFNNNANNWSNDGTITYVSNGVYNIVIPQTGIYQNGLITFQNDVNADGLTNFGIELDITTISLDTSDSYCGLDFVVNQLASPSTYFNFSFDGLGQYFIGYWNGSEWQRYADWQYSSNVKQGKNTNKLKVICRNSQMFFYINNNLVQIVMGHFPSVVTGNGIAFVVWGKYGTNITYDNFKVWSITD